MKVFQDVSKNRVFYKYSCMFCTALCFVPFCEFMEQEEAEELFFSLIKMGLISGDLNKDGDYDDKGEAEVQDTNRIFEYLGAPFREVHRVNLPTALKFFKNNKTGIDADYSSLCILQLFTVDVPSHFVLGRYYQGKILVVYDSIKAGSLTAKLYQSDYSSDFVKSVRILAKKRK